MLPHGHAEATGSGRFAAIPEWIVRAAPGMSGEALRLYLALAVHADPDGRAWPAQRTLRAIAGLRDGRSFDRAMRELQDSGAVTVSVGTGRKTSEYELHQLPPCARVDAGTTERPHMGGRNGFAPALAPALAPAVAPAQTARSARIWAGRTQNTEHRTPSPGGAADAAGGGGGSLDEDRDSTPTETTGPVGDPAGLDLLRTAGVSARVARSLSAEYPVGRIEEVVSHARGHGLGGGWIVTALRDGTEVGTPYEIAAREARAQHAEREARVAAAREWFWGRLDDEQRETVKRKAAERRACANGFDYGDPERPRGGYLDDVTAWAAWDAVAAIHGQAIERAKQQQQQQQQEQQQEDAA